MQHAVIARRFAAAVLTLATAAACSGPDGGVVTTAEVVEASIAAPSTTAPSVPFATTPVESLPTATSLVETTVPTLPHATTTKPRPPSTTISVPPPRQSPPEWLGSPLPLRPDGFGEILPTPPELEDRRFPTVDLLPPPPDGSFAWSIGAVPDGIAARSTWREGCPVGLAELRYVRVSFWGFDDRFHTGELLLHHTVAEDVVEVFRSLHAARFPIEEMRVTRSEELDAPPSGDGNNTGAFVCRPVANSSSWSQHAYGLAIDINPFHNPYAKGDLVLPERASAYLDRTDLRPGMVLADGPVVEAFDAIGWGWGGRWTSLVDYQHFSSNGR